MCTKCKKLLALKTLWMYATDVCITQICETYNPYYQELPSVEGRRQVTNKSWGQEYSTLFILAPTYTIVPTTSHF